MNDHTVTENYIQSGTGRQLTLACSCGLLVDSDPRKKSIRILRVELEKLHKTAEHVVKESAKRKAKKNKKLEKLLESTEDDPEINDPELPEGYQ